MFAPGVAGFNVRFAIEDSYEIAGGFPSFPGMVVDFVATQRRAACRTGSRCPTSPDNYVNAYAGRLPGAGHHAVLDAAAVHLRGRRRRVHVSRRRRSLAAERAVHVHVVLHRRRRRRRRRSHDTILELRGAATGTFGGRVVDELTQRAGRATRASIVARRAGKLDRPARDRRATARSSATLDARQLQLHRRHRRPRAHRGASRSRSRRARRPARSSQMEPPATLAVSVRRRARPPRAGRRSSCSARSTRVERGDGSADIPLLARARRGACGRPRSTAATRYIERAWWTKDGRLAGAGAARHVRARRVARPRVRGARRSRSTLAAGAFVAEQLALDARVHDRRLGRRRLPHPRAAVDRLAACRSTSA